MFHQPTSSKTGMHHEILIVTIARPHMWLPILNLTLSLLILTMWARIQMGTGARSCTAKGKNLPTTVISIRGVLGRIPKPKLLADSAHNWLDLVPAPSHSENAPARWFLNWFQWSITKVAQASFIITDPTSLPLHIRLHNTSSLHRFKSHSKLETFCDCKIMDGHQVQNLTTVFESL